MEKIGGGLIQRETPFALTVRCGSSAPIEAFNLAVCVENILLVKRNSSLERKVLSYVSHAKHVEIAVMLHKVLNLPTKKIHTYISIFPCRTSLDPFFS